MNDDRIAEIRARHERDNRYGDGLYPGAHKDRAWLLAEVERLRGDAQAIAAIAHTGGTAGLSEHEALVEIRRRTLKAWDRKTSRAALEVKP